MAKKAGGSLTDSSERVADTLFNNLESVALVIEGNDTKGNFVPTADCLRDTRERQLVIRAGLQRIRCCVCHVHHERAMNASGYVRKFFKKVFQYLYNFKVDVIAGDANSAACENLRKHEYRHLYNSSVAVILREIRREVVEGRPVEDRLCIDYYNNNHSSIPAQQVILIVA